MSAPGGHGEENSPIDEGAKEWFNHGVPKPTRASPLKLELTRDELALLCDALDSHAYWQLSEPVYRNSGAVDEPGSDDAEAVTAIRDSKALLDRLTRALGGRDSGSRTPSR